MEAEERQAMLEGIAHDAMRMEVVVAQLVDAARLLSGSVELATVPTDLLEAARQTVSDLTAWERTDVTVGGSGATAMVDRGRFRTMLLAMIESAQWFGERGPVMVEVGDRRQPEVRVWREGTTVAPGDADRLFVPRAPGTGGGSKVGLFVARGLAEIHGGSMVVEAGERLTISLALPRPG
jgi:K+-sensing histidine kinase KdpD